MRPQPGNSVPGVTFCIDHTFIYEAHLFLVQAVFVLANEICAELLDKSVEFLGNFWDLFTALPAYVWKSRHVFLVTGHKC